MDTFNLLLGLILLFGPLTVAVIIAVKQTRKAKRYELELAVLSERLKNYERGQA